MDVGYSQCDWSSTCYRLVPSVTTFNLHSSLVVEYATILWSWRKGARVQGLSHATPLLGGVGVGAGHKRQKCRVFFPSFPLLIAG